MNEQSKALARRRTDPRFANRWFVGDGLDVGCGPDVMSKDDWPLIKSIQGYDVVLGHKDAQFLPEIQNQSLDFVHSSHCLEHLSNPSVALNNWLRVLRPGGFIICTVPDEMLYEGGAWPSVYNPDHKCSFSLRRVPVIASSKDTIGLIWKLQANVELISRLTDKWDPGKLGRDQTLGEAECSIEFVVQKFDSKLLW